MQNKINPPAILSLRQYIFDLELPEVFLQATEISNLRQQILQQLDNYLLPRLAQFSAPLLVVLVGSAGVGKSTLLNSMLGTEISATGILRPTTKEVMIICHPDEYHWWDSRRLRIANGKDTLVKLVADPNCPPGLALADTPDIDTVWASNHELAVSLLNSADVALFVTSAIRYADSTPWQLIAKAKKRRMNFALVLNRIAEDVADIVDDLDRMLSKQRLTQVPLFEIAEGLTATGFIADPALAELWQWLSSRQVHSPAVIGATLHGNIDDVLRQSYELARLLEAPKGDLLQMAQIVEKTGENTLRSLAKKLSSGDILRGEIHEIWRELITSEAFYQAIRNRFGIRSIFVAKPKYALAELYQAVFEALSYVLIELSHDFRLEILRNWRQIPLGELLLAKASEAEDMADLPNQIRGFVASWMESLADSLEPKENTCAKIIGRDGLAAILAMISLTATLNPSQRRKNSLDSFALRLLETAFGQAEAAELIRLSGSSLGQMTRNILRSAQTDFYAYLDGTNDDIARGAELLNMIEQVRK